MTKNKNEGTLFTRIRTSIYERRVYWTGFLILLVTYVAVYIIKGYYPFGNGIMLSDTYSQGASFFSELHRKLMSQESLQYTWNGGVGTDFTSIILYYLSSPLSFYYVFFKGKALIAVESISVIIKALLAYTTMFYFLVKRPGGKRNHNSIELLVFAEAYVLNNLFISFMRFYPFLDSMIVFPLLMLGLERMVSGKGRKLYFVSLVLTIMCNYYMGAMICLFIVLYYFTLHFGSVKNFIKTSVKVLITSLLALGCTAFLLFPVVMALQNNSDNISTFLGVGFFNNWFDVLQRLFFLATPMMSGTIFEPCSETNLYMGILVTILALCYFFNRKVPLAQRLRKLILFALLIVSLNESLMNYIMHFFHYANGISNRQILFLIFLAISMAQESFAALKQDRKNINNIFIGMVLLGLLVLLCFSVLRSTELLTIQCYVATFCILVFYGIALLLQNRFEHPKNFVRVLTVCGVLELVVTVTVAFSTNSPSDTTKLFSYYDGISGITKELSKDDTSFYHVSKNNTFDGHHNAGFWMGYRDVEAFSSVISSEYANTLVKMGNVSNYNQIMNNTHTPFLNSLLNVKYIISNEVEEPVTHYAKEPLNQYQEYKKAGDYTVYENQTVLSPVLVGLGDFEQFEKHVAAYREDETVDFGTLQNELLSALGGESLQKELLTDTGLEIVEVKTENCLGNVVNGNMFVANNLGGSNEDDSIPYNMQKDSKATVVFTAQQDGDLYIMDNKLRHFGEVVKGEQYSFTLDVEKNAYDGFGICTIPLTFKLYHSDVWQQAYNQLSTQQMEITDYADNALEGYLSSDAAHPVFTSIPYDKNWKVYVDGNRVKTSAIADAFLSFEIDKGEHQIRMVYSNPNIFIGIIISLVCFLLSLFWWRHNYNKAKVGSLNKHDEKRNKIINVPVTGFGNKLKKLLYPQRTYWIGLLLLAMTYLVIYIVKGLYPFGEYIMQGDTQEQILSFASELHRKLLSHESLQYSWGGGMGANFISIIAYYLSSPLSFYYIFFTGEKLFAVASISVIIKALLAYSTMYYYLAKRPGAQKDGNRIELLLFAGAYALNNLFISFEVFYPFDDVMILFPLVMLGLEQMVSGKGRKLYFVSLILMILCNYYLGFMACLFIVLYYFTFAFGSFKRFLKTSVKVLYTSVLAVGCTAVLLLPSAVTLQQDNKGISEFLGVGFFSNWFDVIKNLFYLSKPVLNGSGPASYSEANLYMGLLITIMALCYFFNKRVPWKQRVGKLILLGILLLSLNESLTNYIMHLFHYTNGIPNRQMLFIVFLVIEMGQASFSALKLDEQSIRKKYIGVVTLIMLALVICTMIFADGSIMIEACIATFSAIIIYGMCLLMKNHFEHPENFVMCLVVLGMIELITATAYSYYTVDVLSKEKLFAEYKVCSDSVEELSTDEDFYHVVRNNGYDYNNMGYLAGYKGINVFSSVVPTEYVNTLVKMGNCAAYDYNLLVDYRHTPLLNSLLNVKYIISNDAGEEEARGSKEPMNQYDRYKSMGAYTIYENKTVLSPVLVGQNSFDEFEQKSTSFLQSSEKDFAELQNSLLQALCKEGTIEDVLTDTNIKVVNVKTENCVAQVQDDKILYISNQYGSNDNLEMAYNPRKASKVTVEFLAQEDGDLYVMESRLHHIGDVKKGKQYSFDLDIDSFNFAAANTYTFNMSYKLYHGDVWEQAYNQLATQQMEITDYTDSTLEGYLASDGMHKVFTSIPYDRNWKVYVDGKQVETSAIADAFLSFTVDKGEHQVRMVYSNPYIFVGIVISLLCVLLSFIIWQHNRKKAGVSGTL